MWDRIYNAAHGESEPQIMSWGCNKEQTTDLQPRHSGAGNRLPASTALPLTKHMLASKVARVLPKNNTLQTHIHTQPDTRVQANCRWSAFYKKRRSQRSLAAASGKTVQGHKLAGTLMYRQCRLGMICAPDAMKGRRQISVRAALLIPSVLRMTLSGCELARERAHLGP